MAKHQCPYCGSNNTEEISDLEKLISTTVGAACSIIPGVVSNPYSMTFQKELSKNKHVFHCKNCSNDFSDDEC